MKNKAFFPFFLLFLILFAFSSDGIIIASPVYSNTEAAEKIVPTQAIAHPTPDSNQDHSTNLILTISAIIIAWSGIMVAILTITLLVVGFLGFNEYRKMRIFYKKIKLMGVRTYKYSDNLKHMQETTNRHLAELAEQFKNDSYVLIEASYNFNEASVAYKNGDFPRAIEYYKKTIKLQPTNMNIYCRLGRAYTNVGKTDSAIEAFEKVLNAEPNHAEALHGMSTVYRFTDHEKALGYISRILDAQPNNYNALDYLGLLLRDKRLIPQAIDAHERAGRVKTRADNYFFLALLYMYQKDYDRAKCMILNANLSTKESSETDKTRTVWVLLIWWAKSLFENQPDSARKVFEEMLPQIKNLRVLTVVTDHVKFLLEAMEQPDIFKLYAELLRKVRLTDD